MRSEGSIYFTDSPSVLYNVGMEREDVQRYLDFQAVFRISPVSRGPGITGDPDLGAVGPSFGEAAFVPSMLLFSRTDDGAEAFHLVAHGTPQFMWMALRLGAGRP